MRKVNKKLNKNVKKKIYYILVIGLFLLSGFLLLYKLGDIPYGIHVDEAGTFYDAKCLVRYGVDRHLYHNPVYLINYGGGQSALYAYLASFIFRVLGTSLWSYRMVSVLLSLVSYIFYFKLVKKYKSKLFSVLVLFLLTILPVYIMKARWGLDCYLLNPLLIISLYFYVRAIEKGNNISYVIAGILFGISFYTYIISYLIIPLFIVISVIYLFIKKKITIKNIISLFVPIIVFGIPLLLMVLVNNGTIENEFVSDFISIPKLWFYRGSEISLSNIKNISKMYDALFVGNGLVYNSFAKFGSMYMFSVPFIVCGFIYLVYKLIKKKCDLLDVLMLILFICVFGVCLCIDDLNINKANAIYIVFVYFIVLFLEFLYKTKFKFIFVIVMLLYCFNFCLFSSYYFKDFPEEYERIIYFENPSLYDALDYANSIRNNNETIYVGVSQGYIYTLLHFDISPYEFNEKAVPLKEAGGVLKYAYFKYVITDFVEFNNFNYIYLLDKENRMIEQLISNGFKKKNFEDYYVLYYEK